MKTVVFYYTQSGQALSVAQRIAGPLSSEDGCGVVVMKEIVPVERYPFPWPRDIFFDTFPETRLGMPPSGIERMDLRDVADADVVLVVGQSWFLSPSLPLQSFFMDAAVRVYLQGRPVVFVNACRNMWLMTREKVRGYVEEAGGQFVGHILLQDEGPNLVSLVTIIRWLVYGKKEGTWLLPAAGITEKDIQEASRFGAIIRDAAAKGDFTCLQSQLDAAGAVHEKPVVMFMEQTGHRMFGFWAKFVRRAGGFRDPHRRWRVKLFDWYLMTVLFVVSPWSPVIYSLNKGLRKLKK